MCNQIMEIIYKNYIETQSGRLMQNVDMMLIIKIKK